MKNKYKNLKQFTKYFKMHKRLVITLITVMILASTLGLILPFFYSRRLIGITNQDFRKVLINSLTIIGIITLHHLFWYLWSKLGSVLTNRIVVSIRTDLMNKILSTKYFNIKHKTSGYYLERLNDDTLEVASFPEDVLGTLVDTITNFSFLILMYILNYKCALLFTLGIIILCLIDLYKIKKDLHYTEILKSLNEDYNSKINETLKGIKDIKGLGIKDEILNSINVLSNEISLTKIKKDRTFHLLSRIKTYSQYIIENAIILYSVGVLITKGEMSTVILLMILNYIGFMYELVDYITNLRNHFIKSEYKAERLLEILNNDNSEVYGNEILTKFNIDINNLTYRYEDSDYIVLKNINLHIKENTTTLFIGQSGSGKSTLFSLLIKLNDVPNNTLYIGNKDINNYSENTLKENLCIINQEIFLLNDTIMNNLNIVKSNATFKEIEDACKCANIYDDIMSFKDGFATVINENGTNLSGGQKQRLGIARALLKNSNIFLFDEPTSALDKVNQKLFFDTIRVLGHKKTILIIAHKFDNYDIFDNVYEVKNKTIYLVK